MDPITAAFAGLLGARALMNLGHKPKRASTWKPHAEWKKRHDRTWKSLGAVPSRTGYNPRRHPSRRPGRFPR